MLKRAQSLLRIPKRYFSLPSYELIQMPALSPTMKDGILVSWEVEEGQEITEGDILASIETDKATIDFENQDSGYIAKILKPIDGDKVAVGEPLIVIVDEEEDISHFKDFTLETAPQPTESKTESQPEPETQDSPVQQTQSTQTT